MAALDPKRLSRTDWLVVGAGAVALVALFLPWFGVSALGFSASVSGWSTSYGWLGGALIVLTGGFLALARSDVDVSGFPLSPALAVLAGAGVGTVIVLLRWITMPRAHAGLGGTTLVSYGPRLGIWLTMVVGVVQVVGAVALFRQSGETLPFRADGGPG